MPYVDLAFRLTGSTVPVDHGYALYAGLSRILPEIHAAHAIGIHPIRGIYNGAGRLQLSDASRLVIRLPHEDIRLYLKLAGKSLVLDGCKLRVGVGETRALVPAATLYCRIATTRNGNDSARFDSEVARQLAALGIRGKVFREPEGSGGSDGRDPSRRIFRVKSKRIVGYSVLATELTAEESILLQERGLGGRRRMGCGVFVPTGGTNT